MSISYSLAIAFGAPVLITDELDESINGWPHELNEGCELVQFGSHITGDGRGFFVRVDESVVDLIDGSDAPRSGLHAVPKASPELAEGLAKRVRAAASGCGAVLNGECGWYAVGESF